MFSLYVYVCVYTFFFPLSYLKVNCIQHACIPIHISVFPKDKDIRLDNHSKINKIRIFNIDTMLSSANVSVKGQTVNVLGFARWPLSQLLNFAMV